MNKIINGRRYNTETAKKIGEIEYGIPGDLGWEYVELYRKQTGEFFLHGEGGARSSYSVSTGLNSWAGGEQITPISYEEARKWVERNLSNEEYERLFGTVDESSEKQTVALRLTPAAVTKLKNLAAQENKPMSDIVESLILSR